MANNRFYVYADMIYTSRIQRLEPAQFKFWITVLCIHNVLPPVEEIARHFPARNIKFVTSSLERLIGVRLIERLPDSRLIPDGWSRDDEEEREEHQRQQVAEQARQRLLDAPCAGSA